MSTDTIRALVAARIAAWSGLPADRIDWPNRTAFTPPDAGIWARVTIQYGDSFMAGMGDTPHTRDLGLVVVQMFDRQGNGIAALGQKVDSLRGHLAYYTVDQLELLAASRFDVGDDGLGFYQINVIVPFRYK
ncbi:MAG: phage tail terminator-like protein [Pseudomonadota bacterium]|nr:phage tail terminator-like protein [Pseudomonadota bacterium]